MSISKSNQLAAVIVKVMYQFAENIETFKVGQTINHRFIAFKNDLSWLPLYFSPGTAFFSESKKESMHGPAFEQRLEFTLPGDLSAENESLQMLDHLPVIVKFTYNNGEERIIGSSNVYALFSNNFVSNNTRTGSGSNFKCLSPVRAFIYQADDN